MGRRKRRGRPINGWLCLDKAGAMTSTQTVGAVRRITDAAKAGHGGTLDPLATGVLPIALGEATKTVSYVMDAIKTYRFTVRFGEARDTDDADGAVVATSEKRPSRAEIEANLDVFIGKIEQVPPSYAAIKVDGERAYDLARRGEKVELAARPVHIFEMILLATPDADHAEFEMTCGKGAYVRSFARDLGERLGCFGHVTELRRTSVGPFSADNSISLPALEQVVADDSLPQVLIPVSTALAGIPALALTEPQAQRLRTGRRVRVTPALLPEGQSDAGTVRAMQADRLVALARLEGAELSPLRVFNL